MIKARNRGILMEEKIITIFCLVDDILKRNKCVLLLPTLMYRLWIRNSQKYPFFFTSNCGSAYFYV